MSAFSGFLVGISLLVILANVLAGDWGDVLDGVCFVALYIAWDTAARDVDELKRVNRNLRALQSLRQPPP